jgi:nitroreductase
MNVSEAVASRKSIRGFLDTPISNSVLKRLLEKASRAPSGGNLQPWKIYVVNGDSMDDFLDFQKKWTQLESPSYQIYPPNLQEPYRTSRYEVGEEMYSLLGIHREDKEARISQVIKNFEFFGAPVGIFCFIDKVMGPPQWSDLGMFLQTFMLLAQEAGISTCAQEAWSMKQDSVSSFLAIDHDDILFCGMAVGYSDPDNPVNNLITSRRSIDDWAAFI